MIKSSQAGGQPGDTRLVLQKFFILAIITVHGWFHALAALSALLGDGMTTSVQRGGDPDLWYLEVLISSVGGVGLWVVGIFILFSPPTRLQREIVILCGLTGWFTLVALFAFGVIDGGIHRWLRITEYTWGGQTVAYHEDRLGYRSWFDAGRRVFWTVKTWGLVLLIRRVRSYGWHLYWMIPLFFYFLMITYWPAPAAPTPL